MTVLTLQELIDAPSGAVWVRNTSGNVLPPGGDIYISVSVSGQLRIITVPMTWIPINLTNTVPRKFLLESPNFMDALNNGLVEAIDDASAAKALLKEDAKEERARLTERARTIKEAVASRGISKNVTVINTEREEEEDQAVSVVQPLKKGTTVVRLDDLDDKESSEEEAVSGGFRAWTTKLNSVSAKEAVNLIKTRGKISAEEGLYLTQKLKHKVIAGKIAMKFNIATEEDEEDAE